MDAFASMMAAEETYIMKSPERRRVMIDLYETKMTFSALTEFVAHIERLSPRIVKLAISASSATLRTVRKALYAGCSLGKGQLYFTPDMEEGKTWLVSDPALMERYQQLA